MADYKKQVKQLISDIRELGYDVTMNGGTHWQVVKDGTPVPAVVIPSTPGDSRWYLNTVRDMKRAGMVDRDPREAVREMKRAKRGGKVTTTTSLDEALLNRRMAMRDRILKVGDTRGGQARLSEAMVETRPEGGVPSTIDGARMMVKRVLQGEGSFHALDAIERGLNALAEAEANRDPLACPECDFVAAHARGLARHRGAKHGVESKIAARRRIASIPCPLCEEKLLTKSGLTTHMIRVHELTDKEERERILMGAQIVDEYKDDLVKLAEEEPEKVEVVVEDPAAAYRRVYPSQVIPLPEPVEEPEVGVEVVADEDYTPPQRKPKKVLDVFDTPLLKLALLIDPAYREEGLVLLEQLADQL